MEYRFVLTLPLLLAASPVPVIQSPSTPPNTTAEQKSLDAKVPQEIVEKFAVALRERYVFPEVGEQVARKISAELIAGHYNSLTKPITLASRLSADAAAIAHDKHLRVWSTTEPQSQSSPEKMPHTEAGITRADKLAGGIGYIEVTGFPPAVFFKRTVDRAMSSLVGSRTLIIDVRRNGGGDPQAVSYLVSFLLPPGQPINDIVSRIEKTKTFTRQSYRSVPTPVSFAGKTVFVLISNKTFSGGEEFAYDIQALKRGTLVGEVTGGGANPTGPADLGHGIVASIPLGRAENPITKTNWEGKGVQPDIPVPPSNALREAIGKAGQKPISDINIASLQQVFRPRSKPLPGSEAALKKLIMGYADGKADKSIMTAEFAASNSWHVDFFRPQLAALGPLHSVVFLRTDVFGGDEYKLRFANGERKMALVVGEDRKIMVAATLAPLEAGD
jgi:hypothetical protein